MKERLLTVMAGFVVLALVSNAAQAGQITGGVAFAGEVTPYESTNGTGTLSGNYSETHSLVFRSVTVSGHPTGSFAAISNGTAVIMFNPLVVNQPVAPPAALWTAGNISFNATSISTLAVTMTTLEIKGVGVFSDGTPADSALGAWTALFSDISYNSSSGVTDPAPSLKIATDGGNAILSWPTNSIGLSFFVQTITNAAVPANWVTQTNVPVLMGNQMVVSNFISSDSQLFRLIH